MIDDSKDYLEVRAPGSTNDPDPSEPGGSRTEPPSGRDPIPEIWPKYDERFGDFVEGGGCGPGSVRVEVIAVNVYEDGRVTETMIRTECYTWAEIETAPTAPTVTPGFAGEVVRRYLPVPRFQMNPADYAVTGIETWLWYGDDGRLSLEPIDHDGDPSTPVRWGATVTATDEGGINTVTARAWIEEYRWEMGDGTVIRSAFPGSEDAPAGEHVYTATGSENTVRASVVWRGSFTVNGVAPANSTLPPITVEGAWEPYPVYQVRSAPVARTGG